MHEAEERLADDADRRCPLEAGAICKDLRRLRRSKSATGADIDSFLPDAKNRAPGRQTSNRYPAFERGHGPIYGGKAAGDRRPPCCRSDFAAGTMEVGRTGRQNIRCANAS